MCNIYIHTHTPIHKTSKGNNEQVNVPAYWSIYMDMYIYLNYTHTHGARGRERERERGREGEGERERGREGGRETLQCTGCQRAGNVEERGTNVSSFFH